MAAATDRRYFPTHEDGWVGSKGTEQKDTPLPKLHLPHPPPVTTEIEPETETDTETDTDVEPTPVPLSPSTSSALEPSEIHVDSPAEGGSSQNPGQYKDGQTLRPRQKVEERNVIAPAHTNNTLQSRIESSVTSPPYWTARDSHDNSSGPGWRASTASADSLILAGRGITLRDNENSSIDDRGSACWAKSVAVSDYIIVNGSATNIGAFVVWNIKVETLSGSYLDILKRYSEFDDFRSRLMRTFPGFEAAVPELPPKSLFSKFRPKFLEKRRAGLQYFLNCIMLNPEFSGSPIVKEFLFS